MDAKVLGFCFRGIEDEEEALASEFGGWGSARGPRKAQGQTGRCSPMADRRCGVRATARTRVIFLFSEAREARSEKLFFFVTNTILN